MRLFDDLLPAVFRSRPNRFVILCELDNRTVRAYLPNPGRLWELLFPGVRVLLTRLPPDPGRKLRYLAVAVERDGLPVMLHTHHTNTVAAHLIRKNLVPGLEGAEIVQPEYRVGGSRFDFLLRKEGREILLEVKSCTLFRQTLAMFPDAVSARATKHLLELEELTRKGYGTAVLFVVHSPTARFFMPEHHTDLEFCRAILKVKDRVLVKAVSVGWDMNLSPCLDELSSKDNGNSCSRRGAGFAEKGSGPLASPLRPPRATRLSSSKSLRETPCSAVSSLSLGTDPGRELLIPWDLVERESHDRGCYLVVMRLARDRRISVGSLGEVRFGKGYYLYAGSAMKDLSKRLARHQRLTKKFHWHIDFLREHAEFVAGIPIRTSADLECELATALSKIADHHVPGFGSSDCGCPSHLFMMAEDPFASRAFSDLLLHFRMGKLEEELHGSMQPRMNTDEHG